MSVKQPDRPLSLATESNDNNAFDTSASSTNGTSFTTFPSNSTTATSNINANSNTNSNATNNNHNANNNANATNNTTRPAQRKRSTSKSQGNYNVNAETLASLSTDPKINGSLNGSGLNMSVDFQKSNTPEPLSLFKSSTQTDTAKPVPRPQLQAPPSLQGFIHVVRLISSDQSQEFLKILNVPIFPETLKVGRQNVPKQSNKITDGFFDSRVLSRNHAELFIENNKLFIRDLKSSNGTFINGEKIEPFKHYEIKVGDKIDLGTTLESQLAHKKITCKVDEFEFIRLTEYQNLVTNSMNKGDMEVKKLELFNSSIDALIFSDVIEDQENIILKDLIDELDPENKSTTKKSNKVETSKSTAIAANNSSSVLTIKDSAKLEDVIKNLIFSINNEYINQQKLKEINRFLNIYNSRTIVKNLSSSDGENVKNIKSFVDEFEIEENEKLKKEIIDLSDRLKKFSFEFEKIEERNKNLEKELITIRGHLTRARGFEKENSKFINDIKELTFQLSEKEVEIEKLQESKILETKDIKHTNNTNTNDDFEKSRELKEQNDTYKSEIEDLRKLISEQERKFQKSLDEKDSIISTLKKSEESNIKSIEELKAQVNKAKVSNETTKVENNSGLKSIKGENKTEVSKEPLLETKEIKDNKGKTSNLKKSTPSRKHSETKATANEKSPKKASAKTNKSKTSLIEMKGKKVKWSIGLLSVLIVILALVYQYLSNPQMF